MGFRPPQLRVIVFSDQMCLVPRGSSVRPAADLSLMTTIETDSASGSWADKLSERANRLVGLASTSSSKYDDFKRWLGDELEVNPSVCYLSDFNKQWTARVGQAFMGLPSLLVLLIEGTPQADPVQRLQRLQGYATGLEATLLFFGSEGAWRLDSVVGRPGTRVFDVLRGSLTSLSCPAPAGNARARVSRPAGHFFDLEPEQQAELVWQRLVGLGSLPLNEAIGIAAKALREEGLLDYTRLRIDGLVHSELEAAMAYASRRGFLFDRPRRGCIRALKSDPDEFSRDDWKACILSVVSDNWVERDATVREAAVRAVEVFGLNMVRWRSGGRVDMALRSALNGLIRLNEVEREGPHLIRRGEGAGGQVEGTAALDSGVVDTPERKKPIGTVAIGVEGGPTSPAQLRRMVGHLPPESESTFERLLSNPPKTVDEMREAVVNHFEAFTRAFEKQQFLDMSGAQSLAEQAEELLQVWEELTGEQRSLAQAAIDYFTTSEEGDDDFVLDGLRTDKAVMAAVLDAVS